MRSVKWNLIISAALLMFACAGLQAHVPQYNITVLPLLPQMEYVVPASLNNLGDIVGNWGNASLTNQLPFLYSNGVMMDLSEELMGGQSTASDINDKGQVVGWLIPTGGKRPIGFVYSLREGATYLVSQLGTSTASSINNAGQVLVSLGAYRTPVLFLPNGTVVELPFPRASNPLEINNHYTADGLGQVLGNAVAGETPQAFLYTDGTVFNSSSLCTYFSPSDMNDVDQIVGNTYFYPSNGAGTCGDKSGGLVCNFKEGYCDSLGEDPSADVYPYYINDLGWVVGAQLNYSSDYYITTSYFLSINTTMYNLEDLIVSNESVIVAGLPAGLNNRGQIACTLYLGGVRTAALLTPITTE